MNKPKISVIIPSRNRAEPLKKCLLSILENDYDNFEIIVIDGGEDATPDIIKKIASRKIRHFKKKDATPGAARNKGIVESKGSILAFTDSDCIAEESWLSTLARAFERNPNISAVGGAIINEADSKYSWAMHILNFSSWLDYGTYRFVEDIPTNNIAYRKKDLKSLRFREQGMGYEDTLFNKDLVAAGKKIVFDPKIKMHHNHLITSKEEFVKHQKLQGKAFYLYGSRIHSFAAKALIKFPLLNYACPRLILVFLRCLKHPKLRAKLIKHLNIVIFGEFVRSIEINRLASIKSRSE